MNKTLLSLQTPCGIIQIEDYYGNHIPFKIKRNDFNWDYGIRNGDILLKRVTTDTNYLIIVDATVLKLGIEYKIFLSGTTLNYGDSDERIYCVSGYSN